MREKYETQAEVPVFPRDMVAFLIINNAQIKTLICIRIITQKPIPVAARSNAWGLRGSNPAGGMDIILQHQCVRFRPQYHIIIISHNHNIT